MFFQSTIYLSLRSRNSWSIAKNNFALLNLILFLCSIFNSCFCILNFFVQFSFWQWNHISAFSKKHLFSSYKSFHTLVFNLLHLFLFLFQLFFLIFVPFYMPFLLSFELILSCSEHILLMNFSAFSSIKE